MLTAEENEALVTRIRSCPCGYCSVLRRLARDGRLEVLIDEMTPEMTAAAISQLAAPAEPAGRS